MWVSVDFSKFGQSVSFTLVSYYIDIGQFRRHRSIESISVNSINFSKFSQYPSIPSISVEFVDIGQCRRYLLIWLNSIDIRQFCRFRSIASISINYIDVSQNDSISPTSVNSVDIGRIRRYRSSIRYRSNPSMWNIAIDFTRFRSASVNSTRNEIIRILTKRSGSDGFKTFQIGQLQMVLVWQVRSQK